MAYLDTPALCSRGHTLLRWLRTSVLEEQTDRCGWHPAGCSIARQIGRLLHRALRRVTEGAVGARIVMYERMG